MKLQNELPATIIPCNLKKKFWKRMKIYIETASQHLHEQKIVSSCSLYHIVLSHRTSSAYYFKFQEPLRYTWKSVAVYTV